MGVWELDGWWKSREEASSDAGSFKATVAIIIVCSCVVAAVIYRFVSIVFFSISIVICCMPLILISLSFFSHHVTTPAATFSARLDENAARS